jgi:GT2 family glycosyltransferase
MLRWREGHGLARPFVSVLIDTYNHERFIEQAVRGALEQDFPASDREILVVDDGSTDRTPEILKKFEPQIRVLRKKNGGQASAFNMGIPECRGEIVAFLDGDDWWAREKLRAVAEALEDTSIGLVGHGIAEVHTNGRVHAELLRESPRFRVDSEASAKIFRLRKSFLGTSRMTFRAEVLRSIGPVPESLTIEADEYLFTLGAVLSDVLILREPLTFYRLHDTNAFQIADGKESSIRRKQRVLEALAEALLANLPNSLALGASKAVIESVEVEAELLRLSLENGLPWETIRAESRSYKIANAHASARHRIAKFFGLLPACVLPSRVYYKWRQTFSSLGPYRRFREKWLPFLEPVHVDRYHATGQNER